MKPIALWVAAFTVAALTGPGCEGIWINGTALTFFDETLWQEVQAEETVVRMLDVTLQNPVPWPPNLQQLEMYTVELENQKFPAFSRLKAFSSESGSFDAESMGSLADSMKKYSPLEELRLSPGGLWGPGGPGGPGPLSEEQRRQLLGFAADLLSAPRLGRSIRKVAVFGVDGSEASLAFLNSLTKPLNLTELNIGFPRDIATERDETGLVELLRSERVQKSVQSLGLMGTYFAKGYASSLEEAVLDMTALKVVKARDSFSRESRDRLQSKGVRVENVS